MSNVNAISVAELDDLLHESRLNLENIQFDSDGRSLSCQVEQLNVSRETRVRTFVPFIWKITVPINVWRIHVRGVTHVEVQNESQIGVIDIDRVWQEGGRLKIEGTPTCVITVASVAPEITAVAEEVAIGSRTFYRTSTGRVRT
jgi:hypothetical protein